MNKKTAIITGASRGIGKAAALRFASDGYNVVLTYVNNKQAAQSVNRKIRGQGGESAVFMYDASSSKQADALIEFTIEHYGKVDALINNAGISLRKLITSTTDEDLRQVLNINLSGTYYLCRAAVREMLKRKEGHIVNISSVFGVAGASMETAYSASKAGIIGLTKALAKETAPSGIIVNCVAPGAIDTDMNSYLTDAQKKELCEEVPLGRFGTPEEVADTIFFLANCTYITGQVINPDGGIL